MQVKQIIRQKEPDLEKLVNIAVDQEKAKSQQKYAKAVEIIKSKDNEIQMLSQLKTKYDQEAAILASHVQQFEEYKKSSIDEITRVRDLFKSNNPGKDIEHIEEFRAEIDRLNSVIEQKSNEIGNYNIVVNSYEEKHSVLESNLERLQNDIQHYEHENRECKEIINNLEHTNSQQKQQIESLIEKVTSLADENQKSLSDKSLIIQKEEEHLEKVSELNKIIEDLNNEKLEIRSEHDSMKDVYFTFLETCHNIVNPDLKITDEFDIEFVQNGILNRLKELQASIFEYETQHKEDQDNLEEMQTQIQALNDSLYQSQNKPASSKHVQTEMSNIMKKVKSTTSLTYSEDDESYSNIGTKKDLKVLYHHDTGMFSDYNQENISKNTMHMRNHSEQTYNIDENYVSLEKYNTLKQQNQKIFDELQSLRHHNMELSQKLELIKIRADDQDKLDSLTKIVEEQKTQINDLQNKLEAVQTKPKSNEIAENMFSNDMLNSQLS